MRRFKATTIIWALCSFGAISQEILDNASVLKMWQAGLSEQVIVAKVKASACTFDLSVDAIIMLKRSGVPDGVLAAMQPKVGNDTGSVSSEWSVGIQTGSSVIPLDDHPMVKTKYVFFGKGLWGWEFPKAPIRVNSGKLSIVTKKLPIKSIFLKFETKNGKRYVEIMDIFFEKNDFIFIHDGYRSSLPAPVKDQKTGAYAYHLSELKPGEYAVWMDGKVYDFGID